MALAGFMGVGKSTVGAALAERLQLPFVDLDERIQAQSGLNVSQIFSCEGESGFRARETKVLRDILAEPPVVLALGGGTLHHGDNLAVLRSGFVVLSLLAPLDEIRARVGPEDETRPLWADAEARYAARAAGYRSADVCVDVSGLSVDGVVSAVLEALPCD